MVSGRVSLFTGLDYWNGLLDWTTGLTQTAIKYLLSVEQKLNVLIQPITLLMLVSYPVEVSFLVSVEVRGYVHI